VYETGPQTTGPLYKLSSTGACQQTSASASYYPTTVLKPPSSFVAAQFNDVRQGDGVSLRLATTSDGAEQTIAMFRSSAGVRCEIVTLASGSEFCVDKNHASDQENLYSSSQCSGDTLASASSLDTACGAPTLAIRDKTFEACNAELVDSIHAITGSIPA